MTDKAKPPQPMAFKNLAELKRYIKLGTEFKATRHKYHPDIVGLTRVVTKVQTNGFYSKIKDEPLYLYSLKEAAEWGEKDEWRESYLENCDCARAIERAIDEHYDGQCLKSCAQEVIDRYGFDRVNFVLAATVRQGTHDGRYSEDNKNWARRFSVMDKENAWQYHVRSHPGLVNLFVADARRLWDKLGLFDGRHCESGSQVDYTDRIVVLDPSILKDECKTPQDQLFYAESGNGCRPNSIGTKVFGFHVSDGEKGYYRRTDFIGTLKEEFVPEWAKENTQKYLEPDEPADEPDEDGGMTMNM